MATAPSICSRMLSVERRDPAATTRKLTSVQDWEAYESSSLRSRLHLARASISFLTFDTFVIRS